jgi:hypothetical protein
MSVAYLTCGIPLNVCGGCETLLSLFDEANAML